MALETGTRIVPATRRIASEEHHGDGGNIWKIGGRLIDVSKPKFITPG